MDLEALQHLDSLFVLFDLLFGSSLAVARLVKEAYRPLQPAILTALGISQPCLWYLWIDLKTLDAIFVAMLMGFTDCLGNV